MNEHRYAVLFLCTGNSARSIMAEALLNYWGKNRFQAFSAGSHPKGQVHPLAIEILRGNHLPTENLRSKSWDEFATPDAPPLDFVFTVCDRAAEEVCPIWPGQPMTAHWGIHDPAAVVGSDDVKGRAFNKAYRELDARIKIFTSLRLEALDQIALQRELDAIGQVGQETVGQDVSLGTQSRLMVARPLTVCLTLALVASLATSPLATCMADPSMGAEAQMACCTAGHDECPMRGSAEDCCKIESQKQQPLALAKAERIQSTVTAPALVAVVIVGSLDAIGPARAIRVSHIDSSRIPPHSTTSSPLRC